MNMTQKINSLCRPGVALMCASVIALSGCGSSFSGQNAAVSSSPSSPATPGGNTGTGGGNSPADQFQNADMNAQVGGGRFSAMQVVTVDKVTKELVVRLPMPANPYIDGIGLQIPLDQLPGARAGIEPIAGGGSALVLRVPLSYVMKGVDFLPATRLPNGDPLPAIPDGEAPSMAIQLNNIKNIKASLYFSVQTLGIFVNTPFDPLIYLQLPLKSQDGHRTWGYLTSIPAHKAPLPAADGGFFIGVQIPDDIARIIDDNL